jgi:hypothetical protein
VNYAIRSSGPVTALTARRVRHGVGPDLICQPGAAPGIKMHSSPAAFPATLSLPSLPSILHLTAPPHPVVPQAAPGSILLPAPGPPPPQQNRYDAASGKNAAARPAGSYSLDASAALSPRPSDPCVDPWAMTLAKRPAFQQVTGDLVTRWPWMQESCSSPFQASSTNPSHLLTSPPWSTKAASAPPTGCVTAASSLRRPVADLQ